jgi:hypothetical protein
MSVRDLSQPSFVDAMGKSGGFLDRIDKAFDWTAFEMLRSTLRHGGARGYPPWLR